MRSRPEHIVEMLREAAEGEAEDVPGLPMTESITWEAADLIEWLMAALARIEAGTEDPSAIAASALNNELWIAAGPADRPLPPGSEELSDWVRVTTEQLIARIKKQSDQSNTGSA